MKQTREAKAQAVLLVGSGYGALKVAEDLCDSGIPLAWITDKRHFLELPGQATHDPAWPEDLAYQFRPLYLRVTRHPLVKTYTRARLESVKKTASGFHAVIAQDPQFVDYDLCVGCNRCRSLCPLDRGAHPPLTPSPAYCPSRALEMDKRETSPCRQACPLGVNAQAYMALTAAGRFAEALAVVRRDNPLPGVCGRICHHPCEQACRRGELDQPLAIRDIKRFIFDQEALTGAARLDPPAAPRRSERVAVVGSGPAGLAAAHFLNQAGFNVTIFEAAEKAGGMLRLGINAFRLPRAVLDAEIAALAESGVAIKTEVTVTSLNALFKQGFNAALLATGTHEDLRLNIPGEDLPEVRHCLGFLSLVNQGQTVKVGKRVLVIGGGNSAMDAARTALRLGAQEVTVAAIETEDELPAHPDEVRQARDEGVVFKLGLAPVAIEQALTSLRLVCRPAHWERPEGKPPAIVLDSETPQSMNADTVVVAIGQRPHLASLGLDKQVACGAGGRVSLGPQMLTSRPGVYAAGDVVSGPSTVIGSMASGRAAAVAIIAQLSGQDTPACAPRGTSSGTGPHLPIGEDLPQTPRQVMAQRQPKARRRDFNEVDLGLSKDQAQAEAARCLQCASCCECLACEQACAEVGAIAHDRPAKSVSLNTPCVIVADRAELPEAARQVAGQFLQVDSGHYGEDLLNVLMVGTVASGQAMAQAARLRAPAPTGDPEPGPPVLHGPARMGFFLCSCNRTMAPAPALDRILEAANRVPGVAHAELLVSLCQPEGARQVAAAVKEHGLNRAIVASCVCCPLNFQCISCNDQRTRARIHLFEELGLDPVSFEMVNLRDHLLAGAQDEDRIVARAKDLLAGAFLRSRLLGPLRSGSSRIGRQVLVLGGSQVGVAAAQNLARQGFKVRLIHRCRLGGTEMPPEIAARPLPGDLGPGITQVEEAQIVELSGHIGDFSLVAVTPQGRKRFKTDVVCLTDENILDLAMFAGQVGLKKFYRYDFSFFNTPQVGVYRVMPRTLQRVSPGEAGAALAAEVATSAAKAFLNDHQLSPQVDPERCRGCGRCVEICPFDAVTLHPNPCGSFTAEVLRYNCVGCGGCVGRCPVTALDSPYFSNRLLDEMVAGILAREV